MYDEYDSVGDEGAETALNVMSGTPTVLGSSYQKVDAVVLESCVKNALLNPSGDAAFNNFASYIW